MYRNVIRWFDQGEKRYCNQQILHPLVDLVVVNFVPTMNINVSRCESRIKYVQWSHSKKVPFSQMAIQHLICTCVLSVINDAHYLLIWILAFVDNFHYCPHINVVKKGTNFMVFECRIIWIVKLLKWYLACSEAMRVFVNK